MLDVSFLLDDVVIYASNSPFTFLFFVLLLLSPFFAASSYLSWQLSNEIDLRHENWKTRLEQLSQHKVEHNHTAEQMWKRCFLPKAWFGSVAKEMNTHTTGVVRVQIRWEAMEAFTVTCLAIVELFSVLICYIPTIWILSILYLSLVLYLCVRSPYYVCNF